MPDKYDYNWVIVDDKHTSWTSFGTLPEVMGEYLEKHDVIKIIAVIRGSPEMPIYIGD
jgi:hypothetical protein